MSKKVKKRMGYNTPIVAIEKEYGLSFGLPKNTTLGAYLEKHGYSYLANALKQVCKKT